MSTSDNILLRKILAGKEEEIVELYNLYKDDFLRWAKFKFRLSEEEAIDIFQDAIIAFYKNIKSGKIIQIDYSIKNYLYAIGKNLISNKLKFNQKFENEFEKLEYKLFVENEEDRIENLEARQNVMKALEALGDPCKTILKLFYFDRFSMEDIAREVNSKNANVAKAQKNRCINELRKLVLKTFKEGDFF
ncbi:RNA polymerase sigma factor [Flexithrix dorotheae]|uniref:RNA polymerase sigma factor n=1 Tax=Flexithrix dorotheae TaxID=70993 RepID=UPI0003658A6E|nr:sigma-70 family RNA polymerase sigma factor [Flexithrix dorotheae]